RRSFDIKPFSPRRASARAERSVLADREEGAGEGEPGPALDLEEPKVVDRDAAADAAGIDRRPVVLRIGDDTEGRVRGPTQEDEEEPGAADHVGDMARAGGQPRADGR